jgi:hypothetical protein
MLAHLDEDVVFLVYGVGGIGKTELVYRLMAEVRERPEWRDAIPVHLELRAGETTTRALAELLATIGAPPEPRSGQPTEVAHLTEQLALLARVLDERPHLVFLDDVHHLPPEPVAEALAHFSRHVRRSRIFVASRREIRLRPGAEPPIVTTLGPLDAEAAAEMMEALAMRLQVERPEPSVLMRSTHGSPFHIRRLLVGSAGDDALARSLDDLGATARRALVLAAVAPLRPAVRVLSGLLGSQRADAEMHADEATTRRGFKRACRPRSSPRTEAKVSARDAWSTTRSLRSRTPRPRSARGVDGRARSRGSSTSASSARRRRRRAHATSSPRPASPISRTSSRCSRRSRRWAWTTWCSRARRCSGSTSRAFAVA